MDERIIWDLRWDAPQPLSHDELAAAVSSLDLVHAPLPVLDGLTENRVLGWATRIEMGEFELRAWIAWVNGAQPCPIVRPVVMLESRDPITGAILGPRLLGPRLLHLFRAPA